MGAHLTSFPLRCFANPRGASTAAATRLPRTFIACTESAGQKMIGPQAGARARRENWPVHELATGTTRSCPSCKRRLILSTISPPADDSCSQAVKSTGLVDADLKGLDSGVDEQDPDVVSADDVPFGECGARYCDIILNVLAIGGIRPGSPVLSSRSR